jgi:hypothetical protein
MLWLSLASQLGLHPSTTKAVRVVIYVLVHQNSQIAEICDVLVILCFLVYILDTM